MPRFIRNPRTGEFDVPASMDNWNAINNGISRRELAAGWSYDALGNRYKYSDKHPDYNQLYGMEPTERARHTGIKFLHWPGENEDYGTNEGPRCRISWE